ncbi:hypothetical protein E3P99_03418 [Wallemia hederae]|uniref:mitogen-activated protein kinase kinase n=1 Tax=Wallemia hederae TaxID=1540922 RepID=A0A4T0FI94_9BASI|nr:hypothetical protein E3P99_03418 [Wallemia hederae]
MSSPDPQQLESSSEEEEEEPVASASASASASHSRSSSPSTSSTPAPHASKPSSHASHGSISPTTPRLPSSLAAKMAAMVNRGAGSPGQQPQQPQQSQQSKGGQPVGTGLKSMRQAPLPPHQLRQKMESLAVGEKSSSSSNKANNNLSPPNQSQSPSQPPSSPQGGLAARRGLNLNLNNNAAPSPKKRGPPGKLNLSNADGKHDTPFSNFSNIVDPSGKLNFGEGKAILHASGVNFSTGHSFNIKIDDLELQDELGRGAYGSVRKAKHRSTGVVMAIKEIRLELDKTKLSGIAMELDILHRAVKPQIVEFYGAFFVEGCIFYCMEFMDAGSLDKLYSPTFGVPEKILAFVTRNLIIGLQFLKDELQIIHRDVKPTNVLVNRRGKVKICDFGVSGQLEKSLAKTNIGCQSYMAPERIQSPDSGVHASFYTVSSDVWSLGLTMVECARGEYPYSFSNVLAQLQEIVKGPPPSLPSNYSDTAKDFIHSTLRKDPNARPQYQELLDHPFLTYDEEPDVLKWIEDALRAKHGEWQRYQRSIRLRAVFSDEYGGEMSSAEAGTDAEAHFSEPIVHHLTRDAEELNVDYIGGVDISPASTSHDVCVVTIAVYSLRQRRLLHVYHERHEISAPYVPSYLAMRESGPVCSTYRSLVAACPHYTPAVLLIDGNGRLHDREAGLATQVGVELGVRSVGVSKNYYPLQCSSRLARTAKEFKHVAHTLLKNRGEYIGIPNNEHVYVGAALLSSKRASNPIFVSAGHLCSLNFALLLTYRLCTHRIPIPIILADRAGRQYMQDFAKQ